GSSKWPGVAIPCRANALRVNRGKVSGIWSRMRAPLLGLLVVLPLLAARPASACDHDDDQIPLELAARIAELERRLDMLVDRIDEVTHASQHSRNDRRIQRDVMRAQREAMKQAARAQREAEREAMRAQRDAEREAMRAQREAMRAQRDAE